MRKDKARRILRLRLREMTIDGMVNRGGPWLMAKRGNTFLGSAHLGMCTRVRRYEVRGPYYVAECGSRRLSLAACAKDEVQAVSTTFGILGSLDLYEAAFPGDAFEFPYNERCLFDSPFWDAMVACAADDPTEACGWGSNGDDRTHMGWRGAMIAEARRLLSRRAADDGHKAWEHEIVPEYIAGFICR